MVFIGAFVPVIGAPIATFFAALRQHRDLPAVRAIRDYRLHEGYLAAVEASIRRHSAQAAIANSSE